jgi:hypothetical protein
MSRAVRSPTKRGLKNGRWGADVSIALKAHPRLLIQALQKLVRTFCGALTSAEREAQNPAHRGSRG